MCVFLCVFCDVQMQCVYTDMFDHVRAKQVDINHGCKYLLENNNLFTLCIIICVWKILGKGFDTMCA